MDARERDAYLAECRRHAVDFIGQLASDTHHPLYRPMLDYPFRVSKGLRPALCIAMGRALGAKLEELVPNAAVLELYHNAFLIHDDVEDESLKRRGEATLHRSIGEAAAINVGDGMLALALDPLLDNMRIMDLGRALRVLRVISRMARESAEGQALELTWIRDGRWDLTENDYVGMVEKKTGWYSFVAPLSIGTIAADRDSELGTLVGELAQALAVAFQIRDDLLNLAASPEDSGKERAGDLWEGKRTLIVTHFVSTSTPETSRWAVEVLSRPRPAPGSWRSRLRSELQLLVSDERMSASAARDLLVRLDADVDERRLGEDITRLRERLEQHGSLGVADAVAERYRNIARERWRAIRPHLLDGTHTRFLESMVEYVTERHR